MKKSVALILVLVALLSVLCSCQSSGNGKNSGPDVTTNATTLPSYVNHSVKEFDSEGNFILTSSDNRIVYEYDGGYVVFTFNGQAVKKVQEVKEFESEELAAQYVVSYMQDNAKNGANAFATGKYAVISCSAEHEDLGKYYHMSKSEITGSFSSADSH